MKSILSLTILLVTLIVSAIVISSTATTTVDDSADELTEEDIQSMIDSIYDDVSTYIKIDKVMGKYQSQQTGRVVNKIALQINPQFSQNIDLSEMIIELSDGFDIHYFYFQGDQDSVSCQSLFDHTIWGSLDNNSFGVVSIFDEDNSIESFQMMNKQSDRLFLLIDVPSFFTFEKGDVVSVTLYPSTGIVKSIDLVVPFSIHPIFSFF